MTGTQTTTPAIKRLGPLQTARDAKILQARLLRMYTKGDIDETFFKTATYGVSNLLSCIKTEHLISPQPKPGFAPITTVELVVSGSNIVEQIEAMNSEIMDPPE